VNADAAARAYFDQRRVVPERASPEDACREANASHRRVDAGGMGDSASAWLLATLQAVTACELSRFLDHDEMPVATRVECRYWAPVAAGAEVRLVGWTDAVAARSAIIRVQVHDAQGLVCEARIEVNVVPATAAADAMTRKRDALARRKLFVPA
jgi:predicted thioesterase